MSHNNLPLQNNTVIIANDNNTFGNITCHSASPRNDSKSQWTTSATDTAMFLFKRRVDQSTFLSFELRPNTSLTADTEGIYHCAILDEEGRLDHYSVWIYRNGYTGTDKFKMTALTNKSCFSQAFQLYCLQGHREQMDCSNYPVLSLVLLALLTGSKTVTYSLTPMECSG